MNILQSQRNQIITSKLVKGLASFYQNGDYSSELVKNLNFSDVSPTRLETRLDLLDILGVLAKDQPIKDQKLLTESILKIIADIAKINPNTIPIYFLLHGVKNSDINKGISKMQHNYQAYINGQKAQEHLIALGFGIELKRSEVVITCTHRQSVSSDKLKIVLSLGREHDLSGLVVARLYSGLANHPDQYLAQAGLVLNQEQEELYLFNLQGSVRKEMINHFIPNGFMGREYARWEARLGHSPRAELIKVIEDIGDFLDYKIIKAVLPKHHPYSYTEHQGFSTTYQKEFIDCGVDAPCPKEPEIYLTKSINSRQ